MLGNTHQELIRLIKLTPLCFCFCPSEMRMLSTLCLLWGLSGCQLSSESSSIVVAAFIVVVLFCFCLSKPYVIRAERRLADVCVLIFAMLFLSSSLLPS